MKPPEAKDTLSCGGCGAALECEGEPFSDGSGRKMQGMRCPDCGYFGSVEVKLLADAQAAVAPAEESKADVPATATHDEAQDPVDMGEDGPGPEVKPEPERQPKPAPAGEKPKGAASKFKPRKCGNPKCRKDFTPSVWNQRYCCEECRP